ncbi:MAG: PadR family transcriptional regulator [Defluviitaleaceae bacterium]|nr:PadR family transcriptional regulator [Defluviitaleaceae bacterium]
MSLPHGLLGLLQYRDRTGYELAKLFEVSLNKFWHAQSSQIYRELGRLEEQGWVTSQNVIQQGKPNKKVYTITESGRAEFLGWMCTPAQLFKNRHSPLLMYTFFGASAPEVTLERLKRVRGAVQSAVEEQLPQNQAAVDTFKAIAPNGEKEALYWEMTVSYGVLEAKALLQWLDECIEKLEG